MESVIVARCAVPHLAAHRAPAHEHVGVAADFQGVHQFHVGHAVDQLGADLMSGQLDLTMVAPTTSLSDVRAGHQ